MVKKDATEIIALCNNLFELQWPIISLWQTIADHFYPERADFTVTRNQGSELADSLVDSRPILVRRDLGDSLSAMLRDGAWYKVGIDGEPDHTGNMWLDWSTQRLMKMMNRRQAGFIKATKQGDHDYITFGQCVISITLNRLRNGLVYQNWHLRDCAWFEDENGQVGGVTRKWKPQYHQLMSYFSKEKLHSIIVSESHKTPFKEADIRHLVIPTRMYGDDQLESRFEWVSLFVDVTHNHLIEAVGMNYNMYVVPRFQTIAGSPYAYSPATVVGLPDARALQAMTHTLLEASERYARPPIIATQKVIRGDVDLSPDGLTWVDSEYDERLGAALRPLNQDRGGFPIGMEMRDGIYEVLTSAFYADRINLPDITRDMTAYEFSERMKRYRRQNLPLFSPIEAEYNGQICEVSFDLALTHGFLGSPADIPESLQGNDILFKFESPLSQSEEEEKATRFSQTATLLKEAVEFDPNVAQNLDFDTAFRDAVTGVGAPAKWLTDIDQVIAQREAAHQQQKLAQGIETINAATEAAMNVEALSA